MLREPTLAYIGLGANLGNAVLSVRRAQESLGSETGIQVVKAASLYRTTPMDSSGPDYINTVVAVRTTLTAMELLFALQHLEQVAGRERPYRNAPRTLDLDLLLFGDATVACPQLTVPHPRMWDRAFVLVPLAEVAPERVPQAALEAVQDQGVHRVFGES